MSYNILYTLEILPYLSWGILFISLVFLEVKNFKEQLVDVPLPEPGRCGFISPPGNGYEYYVTSNSIVYILNKAKNRYRIYLIQGETPNTKIKHDKYGKYFTIRCDNTGTVEKIIDDTYRLNHS